MRHLILVTAWVLFSFGCFAQSGLHVAWDDMLQQYVDDDGHVEYAAWKKQEAALDRYLNALAVNVPAKDAGSKEVMAFWINAYNAFTVKLILKHYPIKSIMDLENGKVWDVRWISLGGRLYSLNEIEHDILRKRFSDARIHFAVNCAARSCPPLYNCAFTGKDLDRQLDERTARFINDPGFNQLSTGYLRLSRIFDWYRDDFGDLIGFIAKYAKVRPDPGARLSFLDYNWMLND